MGFPKQNKGSKPKHMSNPHGVVGTPLKPRSGTPAVEFHGTTVRSAAHEGITRPASGHAGSHDHLAREHGGDGGSDE